MGQPGEARGHRFEAGVGVDFRRLDAKLGRLIRDDRVEPLA